MLTPVGWIGIFLFMVGFIVFVLMNILIEFSEEAKGKFILAVIIWGIISVGLTVWSFVSSVI